MNADVAGGARVAPTRVCVPFSGADEKTVSTGGREKDANRLQQRKRGAF